MYHGYVHQVRGMVVGTHLRREHTPAGLHTRGFRARTKKERCEFNTSSPVVCLEADRGGNGPIDLLVAE